MSTPEIKEPKKEKRAIGVFPRLSLSKSIELLTAIYELGEGEPVRRRTIFDRLGKSAESGPSRVLITASGGGYGLTTGSHKAEYLGITERGRIIATANDPATKYSAIYEALFSNEIFTAFVARFNDKGVPIDEVAISYLMSAHNLTNVDAQACWTVIKDNLNEQNLTQELSGKRVIISQNAALELIAKGNGYVEEKIPQAKSKATDEIDTESKGTDTNTRKEIQKENQVIPQIHFNIQVVIPENATPEKYDAIFKSIADHLLKRVE